MTQLPTFANQRLTVLHVHGAYWHFRGLDRLCEAWGIEREQVEFSLTKPFWQGIIEGKPARSWRQVRNLAKLFRLLYSRQQVVILSISPFDQRLPFFNLVARRHTLFIHCSWAEWAAGPFPKRPKFASLRPRWHAFFRHHVRGVFGVSMRCLHTLRQFAGFQVPGRVVNHAVTDEFHARGRQERAPGRPLRLISVGRLVPSKGLKEIFQVMDGLDPERFELGIVGYGELEEMVRRECERRPNCTFHGRIDGMEAMGALYRDYDVLLLPSLRTWKWQELFGMVTIEAMACGLVPICTDHVGSCEILAGRSEPTHGPQACGFLSSEADWVRQTITWCRKLADDLPRWQALSQAAIAEADRYRDGAIGARWGSLLIEALGDQNETPATDDDPYRRIPKRA